MTKMLKFISYSGEYPCLCMGVLTVEIDGKQYKFGHESESYDFKTCKYNDDNFDAFWKSGGRITGNWGNLHATEDDWQMSIDGKYPDWLLPILPELLKLFNANVEHGCCGGCI